MPPTYETTPVEGEIVGFTQKGSRDAYEIAADITAAYRKAAENGGRIIAGHTVPAGDGSGASAYIMLVTEYLNPGEVSPYATQAPFPAYPEAPEGAR